MSLNIKQMQQDLPASLFDKNNNSAAESFDYSRVQHEWELGDTIRDMGKTIPAGVSVIRDIAYGPFNDENDAAKATNSKPFGKWNLLDVNMPVTPAQSANTDHSTASAGAGDTATRNNDDAATDDSATRLPVIISIHGGGWFYGSKEIYRFYMADLATRGFVTINFNYRLTPEYKFPAPIIDTTRVIQWLFKHADEYHMDTDHIFLIGDSAGGHLAGLYGCLCTNEALRARLAAMFPEDFRDVPVVPDGFIPCGLGLNCGVYNVAAQFSSDPDKDTPPLRDFLSATGDLSAADVLTNITSDYPPTFTLSAENDFLLSEIQPLNDVLLKKGILFESRVYGLGDPKIGHVFHVDVDKSEAIKANNEESAFFKSLI